MKLKYLQDPAAVGPTANKKERLKQKEKKDEKKAHKATNGESGKGDDEPDSPPPVSTASSKICMWMMYSI